jgi:hypothetical protein
MGILKIDRFFYYAESQLESFGLPSIVNQLLLSPPGIAALSVSPLLFPLPTVVPGSYPFVTFLTLPGRLFWFTLLPLFCYGVVHCLRKHFVQTSLLVGYIGGLIAGMFIMFQIFGVRKLVTIAPVYFLFASVGIHHAREYWSWNAVLYAGMILTIVVYNIVRLAIF